MPTYSYAITNPTANSILITNNNTNEEFRAPINGVGCKLDNGVIKIWERGSQDGWVVEIEDYNQVTTPAAASLNSLMAALESIFFLANSGSTSNSSFYPTGYSGFGDRAIYCENGGGNTNDFQWVGLKSQLTGTFTALYGIGNVDSNYGGTRLTITPAGASGGILTYETFSRAHLSGFICCASLQEEATPAASNRMWIGFKSSAFTNADSYTLSQHVAAFRFSPQAGDTTIKFQRNSGGLGVNTVDTGISATAAIFFAVKFISSTEMFAALYDNTGTELWSATYDTNIPSASETLLWSAVCFTNHSSNDAHWSFNSVQFADQVS